MQHVSTRGHSGRKQFCEALLEGLAPDGGLYVPETYPRVDHATLDAWRTLSYANPTSRAAGRVPGSRCDDRSRTGPSAGSSTKYYAELCSNLIA
nr:hypothetical protein [Bradyrhizobium diazoefficiens]